MIRWLLLGLALKVCQVFLAWPGRLGIFSEFYALSKIILFLFVYESLRSILALCFIGDKPWSEQIMERQMKQKILAAIIIGLFTVNFAYCQDGSNISDCYEQARISAAFCRHDCEGPSSGACYKSCGLAYTQAIKKCDSEGGRAGDSCEDHVMNPELCNF